MILVFGEVRHAHCLLNMSNDENPFGSDDEWCEEQFVSLEHELFLTIEKENNAEKLLALIQVALNFNTLFFCLSTVSWP